MSRPNIVRGSECLQYVTKPIGFGNMRGNFANSMIISEWTNYSDALYGMQIKAESEPIRLYNRGTITCPTLWHTIHDDSTRICGLVTDNYSDGGIRLIILGNETITLDKCTMLQISVQHDVDYELKPLTSILKKDPESWNVQPSVIPAGSANTLTVRDALTTDLYSFDDVLSLQPTFRGVNIGDVWDGQGLVFKYQNQPINAYHGKDFTITRDKTNTLSYGENAIEWGDTSSWSCYGANASQNPLELLSGNIYSYALTAGTDFYGACYDEVNANDFYQLNYFVGSIMPTWNGICIPYNLILFNSEADAINYLNNGSTDNGYLFPLDWDRLPGYQVPDDDGTDGEDDNTTDDNTRDVTPNPPVIPSFTPSMLTNNNYYWLTAPELEGFMTWYWQDVGDISDIDDLLAKIEGLYNNLSQAILNIRYMPVEIAWLGGLGTDSNIKIAQIEKAGQYNTISKTAKPIVRDVGHIHIPNKYNSFVDLSPYSQLSVYLPFHGFIDLDINIFSGHDIYVKTIYDFMSGTIQYLIYYDNQFLVTTLVCKMAVDIPISLQTKNERDSAVFQNVSNVVGGLMGAGLSIGTGNPMGLLVGANALNSGVASAPLNVKGNVGETGAFYAPPQCAIILRRPTISKPSQDIWKSKVGQICGKTYTLGNLDGFTTVYNPQISFKGNKNADGVTMKPLESEIREIYEALEKGVIL